MSEQRLPTGQVVYDPRGRVTAEPQTPAPRLAQLDGIRLGVLDNSKWNASKLLRRTVALLEADTSFASVRIFKKDSFSKPAATALLAEVARESDAVITAIGD